MLWLDLMTYLPDDILVKLDRMTMANSLEARSPLLDHKIVELMSRLPKNLKYSSRHSKILLRKLAEKYLPSSILRRRKQGFAIPLASWLQTELRSWMLDSILVKTRATGEYFDLKRVKTMISEHDSGRRDWSQQLWAIIVLELWLQHNKCKSKGSRGLV